MVSNLLENFSEEELLAEISKRKAVKLRKPEILKVRYDDNIISRLQNYINDIYEGRITDEEEEKYYIYEAAMTTYFGHDIFDKINNRHK